MMAFASSRLVIFLLLLSITRAFVQKGAGYTATQTRILAGGPTRGDKIPVLLSLVSGTERGLRRDNKNQILELLNSISKENEKFLRPGLSEGKWELLYTTEKETLFFAKNGLFGAKCTSISQV